MIITLRFLLSSSRWAFFCRYRNRWWFEWSLVDFIHKINNRINPLNPQQILAFLDVVSSYTQPQCSGWPLCRGLNTSVYSTPHNQAHDISLILMTQHTLSFSSQTPPSPGNTSASTNLNNWSYFYCHSEISAVSSILLFNQKRPNQKPPSST